MAIERRFISVPTNPVVLEKRLANGKETAICAGYAAVFYDGTPGTEYRLYPGMKERVNKGCFDRCIRENADIRGLFNHEPSLLLGRISSGTMRLKIDNIGLRYEIDLPDTQAGRDVAELIGRKDLSGSSFSFNPIQQRFSYNQSGEGDDIRELIDVDVADVGPVSWPAYEKTTTSIRAIGDIAELRCVCDVEPRGVVRFQSHDLIDEDDWDADAAHARVRAWASEGDRMSMRKYARAFAWHDGSGSSEGHKLAHHDVRGGKLMTHKGAVKRCMDALAKEDGGGVPEEDRSAVRSHLERHRSWDDMDENDDYEDDGMDERMRMRQRLAEVEMS